MQNVRETFERSAQRTEKWHKIESPTWSNRLKKFFRHPLKYSLYQISKKYPISITTRTFLGSKFNCYLPDYFLMWCYGIVGDPAEVKLTRFLLKNIKEGDTFFDVGSNCGFYALLSGVMVGESGSVHAFEPTPHISKLLSKNTSNLKIVKVVEAAVSEKDGEAYFNINPINPVANSLVLEGNNISKKITVKTLSLDSYSTSIDRQPNIIKLDVEGNEEAVIKGARGILESSSPIVCMEILSQEGKVDFGAVSELSTFGYKPHCIMESGEIQVISIEEIKKLLSNEKNYFDNFVFKKT